MQLIASNQAEINRNYYAKAPTIEEIDSFLSEVKITQTSYERLVGMRRGTIYDVRIGYRPLPARFWALIFNKVVPPFSQNMDKLIPRISSRKPVYKTNNSTEILDKLSSLKG